MGVQAILSKVKGRHRYESPANSIAKIEMTILIFIFCSHKYWFYSLCYSSIPTQ